MCTIGKIGSEFGDFPNNIWGGPPKKMEFVGAQGPNPPGNYRVILPKLKHIDKITQTRRENPTK